MILNLTYPNYSGIKFKVNKFPDGQQSIELINFDFMDVIIKSRLNSFLDLELIICAVKAIRYYSYNSISLSTPYFLGARSDRKFITGGINYLKDIICPIINSLNLDEVTVFDAHSDVLEACLNNYSNISNKEFVDWALKNINRSHIENTFDSITIISPDTGAYKKIFTLVKELEYIKNLITAEKVRNLQTGEIIETKIDLKDSNCKNYVIIDDICDGGRTFIEIAKKVKEQQPDSKLYLIVSHGIFSQGFSELNKYFEKIYCTNSFKDIDNLGTAFGFVEQYNIFE